MRDLDIFRTEAYKDFYRSYQKEDFIERVTFPDGERYLRLTKNCEGVHAIVIGGTIDDANTLELYDLATAAVEQGAEKLTVLIPYFGYATMERRTKNGEAIKAKTRARLLSSIPRAAHGNHFVFLDLHADGIVNYFENGVHTKHVYAKEALLNALNDVLYYPRNGERIEHTQFAEKIVLASTDAGRAKWVESLATEMGVDAAYVLKKRVSGDKVQLTAVSAHVQDKVVVIYDDMIRTGGSLLQAAKAYKDAGAKEIIAMTTHGVLPGDSYERIRDSALFSKLIATNSHPRVLELSEKYEDQFLRVASIDNALWNNNGSS